MHELWLCRQILDIVKQKTQDHVEQHIKHIYLEVGQLAGIDPSALEFSFEVVARGSVAENAILVIIDVPAKARCEHCGQVIDIQAYGETCPTCSSSALTITQGESLRVKSLEVT